jgi:hypothetical protein
MQNLPNNVKEHSEKYLKLICQNTIPLQHKQKQNTSNGYNIFRCIKRITRRDRITNKILERKVELKISSRLEQKVLD